MAKLIDLNGLAHVYSIIKGMLADKLGKNDVATVATSGSYNDLSDKPTIPSAYTLPTASSTVLGGVKIGSNISVSSGTISITKSNVTSALGYTPPTSDTVYDNATTTTAGLMSASDKVKLNNIADNANNYTHPSTHPASMITGLASVATSGSYSDLSNKPTIPVVPTNVSAFINDAGYLTQHQSLDDYAKKTDISGFVKTVNGTAPDTNGNVAINVSGGGGVSTSEVNTWTAEQIFNDVTISGLEKSEPVILHGNSITPTSSHTIWQAEVNSTSSLCTLNLDGLLAKANKISRFEILFSGGSSKVAPTLKITSTNNNIPIFYPSDTRCGLLFSVVHGMIIDSSIQGDSTAVFIKIDFLDISNFDTITQEGGHISS